MLRRSPPPGTRGRHRRHRRRARPARRRLAAAGAAAAVAGLTLAAPAIAAVGGLSPDGHQAAARATAEADGLRQPAGEAEQHSRPAGHGAPPSRADSAGGRPAGQARAPAPHPAATPRPAASSGAGHGHDAPSRQHPASPPPWHLIYDSIIPEDIPPHRQVATYATGGYAVTPDRVAGRGPVLWIDTKATDPAAGALDIEPGDATPEMAAPWVRAKLHADPHALAILYTGPLEWPLVKASVSTLPSWMQARVRWWIANPTGYPHLVPGSDATQWFWGPGYDISSATPRF